jgi:hypothetical protein
VKELGPKVILLYKYKYKYKYKGTVKNPETLKQRLCKNQQWLPPTPATVPVHRGLG